MFGDKGRRIKSLTKVNDRLFELIKRATVVLGVSVFYGEYEYMLNLYLSDVEEKRKVEAERLKIELIMHDLLKANVFKQVETTKD
jgi:hypothetical protein